MNNESIFSKICGQNLVDSKILIRLREHPRKDVVVNKHGASYHGVCIADAVLVKEETIYGRK